MKIIRKGWPVALAGAALLFAASAGATTYCVAPDGTPQGDGTRQKPFSIEFVAANVKLQPGDEVVFADGVYPNALRLAGVGNEKAPITWRAENRQKAIIDGGKPITGWQESAEAEGVWECSVKDAPRTIMVDGDGLISSNSTYRKDGKATLDEGMFSAEPQPDKSVLLHIHPWANREPKEVFAINATGVDVAGSFNVVDGLVVRHWVDGLHLGGRQAYVYSLPATSPYWELSGLEHNAFGSFNIVRNCIIRDSTGQGMTSNESRFNLIEDCVIYNSGNNQGDHGIYVSQGAENLTLRRNIWWRSSGAAIQIYSGTGIDSPRGIVCEYNIIGPDKRNRCFPLANRKSLAFYVYGGHRWAGYDRIVHNIVIGPVDRAMSMHRSNFNLVANNTFLNSDGATIQIGLSFGTVIANNIIEYAPGAGVLPVNTNRLPPGYVLYPDDPQAQGAALSVFRNNLLLPRDGQGAEFPAWLAASTVATGDPFVGRAKLDFHLKPGSEAVGMGIALPNLTSQEKDKDPDVGAIATGAAGEKEKFPEIPAWLLTEWPVSKRGQ